MVWSATAEGITMASGERDHDHIYSTTSNIHQCHGRGRASYFTEYKHWRKRDVERICNELEDLEDRCWNLKLNSQIHMVDDYIF